MSSFIINREEYIKVAGFLSALNDKDSYYGHESGMYLGIYDKKGNWRLMSDDDFIRELVSIYNANVISVERQYDDARTITAVDDYSNPLTYKEQLLFDKTKLRTQNAINRDRDLIKRSWFNLNKFISSIYYQVEDREMIEYIQPKLNEYLRRSSHVAFWSEYESNDTWGDFNLGLE